MKNNDNRILVILDLDETLIHATKKPLFPDWQIELEEYKIFKRQHLRLLFGPLHLTTTCMRL